MVALGTAKSHFDEDVTRAEALLAHAAGVENDLLRTDILRGSWMMAAGATDAYFCDAYADLISRVLKAKELQKNMKLPDTLGDLRMPVTAVLRADDGWRWRMAARALVEKQSVLSLSEIKTLFRRFCRASNKLLVQANVESWIVDQHATKRLWGVTRTNYLALTAEAKRSTRESALKTFERRIDQIFQRRHDCIHSCDRPRTAVQSLTSDEADKAIRDLKFLVQRCQAHLSAEFPEFLADLGASGATRNHVGA